jgi:hypothetical protein
LSNVTSENISTLSEKLTFSWPATQAIEKEKVYFWQNREMSSQWETGEKLSIHQLFLWNHSKLQIVDSWISYEHKMQSVIWFLINDRFEKQDKMVTLNSSVYQKAGIQIEPLISTDEEGHYLSYTKATLLLSGHINN